MCICVHFIHALWKETALRPRCVHWCVCMCMCVCEWEREKERESLFQNTLLSCPGWVSSSVSCITMRRFTAEEKPTQNTNTHKHTLFLWFCLFLYLSLPLSSIKPHTFLSVYSSCPRESVLSCSYCPRVFITSSICCPLRWCHTAQSLVRLILNCTSTVISLHTLHSKTWIQRLETYTISLWGWSTMKNKCKRFQ